MELQAPQQSVLGFGQEIMYVTWLRRGSSSSIGVAKSAGMDETVVRRVRLERRARRCMFWVGDGEEFGWLLGGLAEMWRR